MKRSLLFLACFVPFFFGPLACKSQNTVNLPQPTCPPVGSYTQLPGSTNGTASLSYTATGVSGATCFVAQGSFAAVNGAKPLTGNPTNIIGPEVGGASGQVALTVTPAPTGAQTAVGELWTFFSAPATTVLAPANGTMGPPTTSQTIRPALPDTDAAGGELALVKK